MAPGIEMYFQDLTELQEVINKQILDFAIKQNDELVEYINQQQKQIEKVFFL